MTHAQKMAVFDAADATLQLLSERRTRGRFELYLAVKALLDAVNTGAAR